MSIRDCIADLVVSGKITKEVGRQALSLNERAKAKVSRDTPPASLEAATGLITAKMMRDASQERLLNVSANVYALRAGEERVSTHPSGGLAGLADILTRSLHRDEAAFRDLSVDSIHKTSPNVEGVKKATRQFLDSKFSEGLKNLPLNFWGQGSNATALLRNMTYELFGHDTGDKLAKGISAAWTDTMDWAVNEAKAAGKIFDVVENWRLPQSWNQWRVSQFGLDEFRRDVLGHVNDGNLTLFDRDTGRPGDDVFVTERAFRDLAEKGGNSAPFSRESRTFVFGPGKGGADAYLHMMEKYGHGTNQMLHMMNHLDHASQEMGLIKVLGPNHQANWTALKRVAKENPKPSTEVTSRFNPQRATLTFLESENALDGTYKVLAGGVHPVHDDFISSALSAARNLTVATSLKSALFVVSGGDMITQMLAASHIGINPFKQMISVLTPGGVGRKLAIEDAAHMHIDAHAASEWANGVHDFNDHVSAFQVTGKMASAVTKATFLDMWGRNGKRTWQQNVLNLFGRHRGETLDELSRSNPRFHQFLDSYGFGAADWDKLRANTSEIAGANYLDPNKLMSDASLYNRVMTAVQESSAFAMHQADARLRSVESGLAFGVTPGSKSMQFSQAAWQFKTFALSRLTTQLTRIMTDASMSTRIAYGTGFAIMSMASGMMALQALRIVTGKDLLPMNDVKTWLHAMAKSGIGGIWGDMVKEAAEGDKGLGDVMAAASPLTGLVKDLGQLAITPMKRKFKELDGEHVSLHGGTTFGQQLTDIGRRYTPSTWYAELAVNRFIFDTVQKLIDPEWRHSFRRLEAKQKLDHKSGFWWSPGESAPRHFPQRSTHH